ncbi:MAG: hypothetical protein RCG15_01515 [Candidatus Rickettsia vulgarisii]
MYCKKFNKNINDIKDFSIEQIQKLANKEVTFENLKKDFQKQKLASEARFIAKDNIKAASEDTTKQSAVSILKEKRKTDSKDNQLTPRK